MTRLMPFVFCALTCALVCVPAGADDLPKKLTPEERKGLESKFHDAMIAGGKAYQEGKSAEAVKAFEEALKVARHLYSKSDFPDGHTNLAASMRNLGLLYQARGKLADAEPLLKETVDMLKRLFKDKDHPDLASSLNNLAALYLAQGKLADAEPLLKDALAMAKRLFKDTDHPDVTLGLNNLAVLYQAQGKLADAEPLLKDALAMTKRLFKDTDHPDVATSLDGLGGLYLARGKLADAEPLLKETVDMLKRLFKDKDHLPMALGLSNLARLYQAQGKLADAEPLFKDALAMTKRLFKDTDHPDVTLGLSNLAALYLAQGKLADAEPLLKDALAMAKRLFKDTDHPNLVTSLSNLARLYLARGKLADAEPLFKDALEMTKRRFKDTDHPDLAASLSNLARLYLAQGKLADAEPLLKDALAMTKRLFKDTDHPDVATSLDGLGRLYLARGKLADAEPLLKDALAMAKRLFKDTDHPNLATSLSNLARLYGAQGKLADAEPLLKDALEMTKRLFKDTDHPNLASSLNNLAALYLARGKLADAEPLFKDALEMYKRLFKDTDHPDVTLGLNNLAVLSVARGKLADAEPLFKDALEMTKRLTVEYAKQKSEGEALIFISTQTLDRNGLLSVARSRAVDGSNRRDPALVYPALWSAKGTVARVFEQRLLQTRAASTDPALAKALAELAEARRRRAELLLAPATKDSNTLKQREADLKALDARIEQLGADLSKQLPAVARLDKLNAATLTDLQNALPADAALVDYTRYVFFEFDNTKPVSEKWTNTWRYVGFVVTREKVTWVDLDTEAAIKPAVAAWRAAIDSGKEIPATVPAKVRELVWDKVRKTLPATTKTAYICPDADLCSLPFAALPGDKPGTILLEDFALATVPHAPFLLDKLWPQDSTKNAPTGALVVGGVKYDAEVSAGPKGTEPLLKPDQKLAWGFLPNTVGELNGVASSAVAKKLPVTRLDGDKATAVAVLSALPKAKVAHFATHGFLATASFRGPFQLDENNFQQSLRGERIGRAAISPLVMTGLVLAGANNAKTPGRGIVTGEGLIDLDLSGLELAVLSACETGLGALGAGGEGVFGLQRAFHYAGARNVVCSLWKVPDESTAALMNLFYKNLWEKNLTPMEALRQAQLHLYRNPGDIPELAKGFRGKFEVVPGTGGEVEIKPAKDGKAHPLLWAAFTLSGPGR